MALVVLTVAGGLALLGVLMPLTVAPAADRVALDVGSPGQKAPASAVPPTQTPPPSTSASPVVLRLPGPVPSTGSETFQYATGLGSTFGRAGLLRRYRVAVEHGTNEDVTAFTAAVDSALGDPGSWIGSGRLRLQRVPQDGAHDFTVYLATAGTAREMCAAESVDIRIEGKPYTSCRGPGKVILNLDRWRLSVSHYIAANVPLDVYRAYVVNHEVGHELGHGHERCPGAGRPAPVMMQQTLFLNDCVANPWPYVRGERYAGPPL